MKDDSTYPTWILAKIKKLEIERTELISKKDETYTFGGQTMLTYSPFDYNAKFHRLCGQIDILYMCLTGHDNSYDKNEKINR